MSAETREFRTELKQLLHLIIHSLYSHKDIFLRELISNASDAIDTIRFQSLTRQELLEGDSDWRIKLVADEKAGTLTVSDNGVGMSPETVAENLGTIARSGTKAFLETLKAANAQQRPELIGQFGVGFYSAFMVADKVTVLSRQAGDPGDGVRWESDGQGSYTVEKAHKPTRGTDVTLHLKAEDKEFLQPYRLRQLVKKYSDFVEHPVVMDVEREEGGKKDVTEETLNSRKALWLRPKAQVTPEEYAEFYKHLAHDTEGPAKTIHYAAEGTLEFKALLYVPAHKPFDLTWGDSRKGLHLYIQRVFIMDDCEVLLPLYLRFVKGVVDSPDLPLNVSREILQQSAPLEKIKSNLVGKVLSTLDEMKRKEWDAYCSFFAELGTFLKEGAAQDWSNREKLADLLLFQSTKTERDQYSSLEKYVEGMPADQKEIYYLIGESRETTENSPYLEAFKAKGYEVMLLDEPVDEFVVQAVTEYKGKKLKAVDKGILDHAAIDEGKKQGFGPFLDFMKSKLADLKEVRLSNRLKESAVCLVTEEGAMGAHMERFLQKLGKLKDSQQPRRILEVNPDHPAVLAVRELFVKDPDDARLETYCRILHDQAILAETAKVKDFTAMARRVNELLAKDASQ